MLRSFFSALGRSHESESHSDDIRTDGGVADPAMANEQEASSSSILRSEFVQSLPFWGPPALLVGLFVYGAVAWNVLISLTDWSGLGQPEYSQFDLSVYTQMANELLDPTSNFFVATRNTVALLLAFTVITLLLGLLLAILVDQGVRLENTFRTIYLLPMSLSFVVTAIFWSWMYNPSIGLINETLRAVGLGAFTQEWISDPQFKLAAVIFALMWQFSGYAMVVYLAGLQAIPTEQYEAARTDGASTFRMYRRVIIPQLRSSTTSAAVVLMVFALKAFDFLFVMFGPNPGPSTDILSVMMFREAFMSTNWAYGSGIATVLFVMALGVIAPYLYRQYQRGEL
jgi:glucose/mannose transport system permease protein